MTAIPSTIKNLLFDFKARQFLLFILYSKFFAKANAFEPFPNEAPR
jgi:hypothetical protein